MGKRAVIDVGTNSVKFLLAEVKKGNINIIYDFGIVTSLGKDTKRTGIISEESLKRTLSKISTSLEKYPEFLSSSRKVVATEALRSASNRSKVLSELEALLCAKIEVITPDQEIRYCISAVSKYHALEEGVVVDLGGGSLDIGDWNKNRLRSVSLPFGILFLHDEYISGDPPTAAELSKVEDLILAKLINSKLEANNVVAIGATARIISNLSTEITTLDNKLTEVNTTELKRLIGMVTSVESSKISTNYSIDTVRAKLLPVGISIYKALFSIIGNDKFYVSGYGLRHGVLIETLSDI
jgi:exopolyphosphatase/guanosine-5'-triphosphate,3'-diphosphate pyrophosphatase